jgi:MYXO-CTERM domain-containing protein
MMAAAGLLAIAGAANAQFSGPYDHSNWALNANGGDGSAVTSPTTLDLTGNDAGGSFIATDYTIAAAGTGLFSFDWKYSSGDTGTYDTGGYLINGVYTVLAANNSQGGGSVSVAVNAGDIIGFRVESADGAFGPGLLNVGNFSGPVPAPGALALLGLGGLVAGRRRR